MYFRGYNWINAILPRIENVTIEEALTEAIKNADEYKLGSFNIQIGADRVTIHNDLPQEISNKVDLDYILECMTSFNKRSEQNYNEGSTCFIKWRQILRVKGFVIETKQDENGLWILVDEEASILDGSAPDCGGWELTIISQDAPTKIIEVIDQFYFKEANITINGEKYAHNTIDGRFDNLQYGWANGDLKYKLEIDQDQKVLVFWTLNTGKTYQLIPTKVFDNRGVSGMVILSSIKQFEGLNRTSLCTNVNETINQYIKDKIDANKSKSEVIELMKHAKEHKKNMEDFITSIIPILKSDVRSWFKDHSLKTLKEMSSYCQRLQRLVELSKSMREKSEDHEPFFDHRSLKIKPMYSSMFRMVNKYIKADLRTCLGDIAIGQVIVGGEVIGVLYTKDTWSKQIVVNPGEYELMDIISAEIMAKLLYPIGDLYEYLIPDDIIVSFDSDSDYESTGGLNVEIQVDDDLKNFFIGKIKKPNKEVDGIEKAEALEPKAVEAPHDAIEKLASGDIMAGIATSSTKSGGYQAPSQYPTSIGGTYGPKVEPKADREPEPKPENKLVKSKKQVKKEKVGAETKYIIINDYNRGKFSGSFPVALTKKQYKAYKKTGKISSRITLRLYEMWKQAISMTIKIIPALEQVALMPTIYMEKNNTLGYITTRRFIALNANDLPREGYGIALRIVTVCAHEIAHLWADTHGAEHEKRMEGIFYKMCEVPFIMDGSRKTMIEIIRKMAGGYIPNSITLAQ